MWQVVGQTKAVDFLSRSLKNGRLSHAYLFTGPEHVGKMTLAQNLAQAVNCEEEEKPCGECSSCRRIAQGNHPDVQVLGRDKSKVIGIDRVREMQHAVGLKPYEGRYRVFIIDGAEHLSEESANSLLKTLEEPPSDVLIILLTVNQELLLPTVVSRCHRIELVPIPAPTIERALIEHWEASPERAKMLSRICQGGIGWAISALSDDELLQERARKLAKLTSLADASIEERFSYAARLAGEFSNNRGTVQDELRLWQGWWRDLLLIRGGCAEFISNIDQETMLHRQAGRYSLPQIKSFIEAIGQALKQLDLNANPRLVLEVLMLNIPNERKVRYA
jgi:DNA polymerase-3 subunit delta'